MRSSVLLVVLALCSCNAEPMQQKKDAGEWRHPRTGCLYLAHTDEYGQQIIDSIVYASDGLPACPDVKRPAEVSSAAE